MSHPDQARPHEHEEVEKSKARQPHGPHEEHGPGSKGPHDTGANPEINPKLASDIAYWAKARGASGETLHDAIRTHGTRVAKIRAALQSHKTA